MILDELVDAYRDRLPGCDMACSYQAGIPVYKARLKADVLRKQDLPAVAQFVQKLIDLGIDKETELAEALGLEMAFVHNAVAHLDLHQLVVRRLIPSNPPDFSLALTARGKQTLNQAMAALHTKRFYVQVDGLTGAIAPVNDQMLKDAQELRKMGFWLLHASPGKRPTVQSMNQAHAAVELVFEQERDVFEKGDQLIEILDVERFWLKYKLVSVLVFRDRSTRRLDLRVFEGYEPIPEYDRILTRRERSGGRVIPDSSLVSMSEIVAPSELARQLEPDITRLQSLHEQIVDAEGERDDLQASLKEPEEQQAAEAITHKTERIQELETRIRELKTILGRSRIIQDSEHRQVLKLALSTAKHAVLIISPWIKKNATDEEIVSLIRKAVRRGVFVVIGYGMPPGAGQKRGKDIDEWVERQFDMIQKQPGGKWLLVEWHGNTHEKILVCDERFCVLTSFNWLSYRGDQGFRKEMGNYFEDRENVERVRGDVIDRFKSLPDEFWAYPESMA